MANSPRLELLRRRTFGEIVGDTFAFIRLNLAVILKTHFLISLPIILVTAAIFLLLFRDYFTLLRTIEHGPFIDTTHEQDVWITRLVMGTFSLLAITPISINTFAVVACYQRSSTGVVTFEEVWQVVRRKYLLVFLAKIIIAFIVILSGIFLLVPTFMFYTFFLCVELLIIQHNFSPFKAIGHSTNIMSKYFWMPLLVNLLFLLVFSLLTGFGFQNIFGGNGIMELPIYLLDSVTNYTTTVRDENGVMTIVFLSLRTFNLIAGYILYTIPTVASAILYYSIREKLSQANIMDRIRNIGLEKKKKVNEFQLADEEY
jgi:hypothetical protein